MIIKAIGCILFAVGAFILLTQDMSNVNIRKLKIAVASANTGLIILFATLLAEPFFGPAYMALIMFDICFFIIDIIIVKSIEKQV